MIRLLILSFLLFFSCKENTKATNVKISANDSIRQTEKINDNNWSGKWIYSKKTKDSDIPEQQFTLTIFQIGEDVKAQYCAIANGGGKIDCEPEKEYNVVGKMKNGKIAGEFYSFFGSSKDKGKFEISIVDNSTINWKIINAPKGTFYAPDNCLLTGETIEDFVINENYDIEIYSRRNANEKRF